MAAEREADRASGSEYRFGSPVEAALPADPVDAVRLDTVRGHPVIAGVVVPEAELVRGSRAERLAMEARRNSCEALFSALQLGNKLGLDGAARTRTAKEPTVEALLSIALMQRSALMLADLRIQRGLFRDDVPPDLA